MKERERERYTYIYTHISPSYPYSNHISSTQASGIGFFFKVQEFGLWKCQAPELEAQSGRICFRISTEQTPMSRFLHTIDTPNLMAFSGLGFRNQFTKHPKGLGYLGSARQKASRCCPGMRARIGVRVYWVAGKELKLSYSSGETLLFTIYTLNPKP